MTIAVYPPELPQHWMIGLEKAPRDGRLRTEPQRGPALVRGGSDATPDLVTAGTVLATGQLARFWRFWVDELGHGVQLFRIRDQQADGVAVADDSGSTVLSDSDAVWINTAWWICRFGKQRPRETSRGNTVNGGGVWLVSFEVELL